MGIFGLGDPSSSSKGIQIQYSPTGVVSFGWWGSLAELVGGSSISEGTALGNIGEGLARNTSPDANLVVRYRTSMFTNSESNMYVDESGRLYVR